MLIVIEYAEPCHSEVTPGYAMPGKRMYHLLFVFIQKNDTLRLVVTVEDEVSGANNNVVRVPISLIVLDDNDNAPKFLQVCMYML